MLSRWEQTVTNIATGKTRGPFAALARGGLRTLSWLYLAVIKLRKALFQLGLKKSDRPDGPTIISVGNIVAGGTGKTPATMLLAKEFYPDTTIAFLSRGYRSLAEKEETPTTLSRGNGPIHSALYCGDEPCIISDNFPKALSYVGKRRDTAARWAADAGAQLIILDDGMQHLKLERDFDVAVIDAKDPFGQGYFLPRGMLRDEPKELKRASLILINHVDNEDEFKAVKAIIQPYTNAPVVGTRYKASGLIGFDGRKIESYEGEKVGLFCSIAKPDSFKRSIEKLNLNIVDHYSIPDHHIFDLQKLRSFAKKCQDKGAEMILCTEKDRVKLVGNLTASIKVAWLKIEMEIIAGKEEWNTFITTVKNHIPAH